MSIPEEIDRYSRLFSSIIIQAIMDAGIKPNEKEKNDQINRLPEVVSAIEYLFGCDRHVFAHHADLVGADANQIRESLLYRNNPIDMKNAHITLDKLRILRIRYRWHQRRNHV